MSISKPAPLPVDAVGVPDALKALSRWVCWRWTRKGKKWDKPPFDPRTGRKAKSDDPSTWCPFAEALAAHRAGDYDGIGFVLGRDPATGITYSGVDVDDQRDPETGALDPFAAHIVAWLDSYAEISPSQTGVKVFTIGELPRGRRADHSRGIELYDGGRYFCVTGRRLPEAPADVRERAAQLAELHALVFGNAAASDSGASSGSDRAQELSPALERRLGQLVGACATADDRSKADFARACWALEQGIDRELIWDRLRDVGKCG
jgi:primase-polymerase (primpol)-like protein